MIIGSVATMTPSTPPSTPPVADFVPVDAVINQFGTVDFEDRSTNTPTSWLWTRDGVGFSILQNPTLYFENPGTFTIELTATNSFGSDSFSAPVTVVSI